jgi:hypothetical protein
VRLHPAAEELELIIPGRGTLIASAKTSTVGPGYHIFLCDLLRQLGDDLRIEWDPPAKDGDTGDDTGYFHNGDPETVTKEILAWLKGNSKWVLEQREGENHGIMLSMALGHQYLHDQPALTPVGPREWEWFEAVSADPRKGVDFFPWWSSGIGADFYFGRALVRMWTEVRWRTPLSEEEASLLEGVHCDLEHAFWLDSTRSYPWREWHALVRYLEEFGEDVECDDEAILRIIEERASEGSGPLIGYRRRPVRVDLGGRWSVEIPGEFAEEWDEDGNWSAWDSTRTVWFTSWSVKDHGQEKIAEEILKEPTLDGDETLEHRTSETISKATLRPYEEDGKSLWNLKSCTAAKDSLAVCNIYLEDINDRDWALQVWRSIEH